MYFSDREQGTPPRTKDEISLGAWRGLVAVIVLHFDAGLFAAYPAHMTPTDDVHTLDKDRFIGLLMAEIPSISWPLGIDKVPPTVSVLDLIEFCHKTIYKPHVQPKPGSLAARLLEDTFVVEHMDAVLHGLEDPRIRKDRSSTQAAKTKFREQINRIFARNGLVYELDASGMIQRTGVEVLSTVLVPAVFQTRDATLDTLLEDARIDYLNNDPNTRRIAVEKLWDAWERLKTMEHSDIKKGSIQLLAKAAPDPKFREMLDQEARALTDIGNQFQIRHHDTLQVPLARDEDVDYVFHRLFALIRLLLKTTGRGG